MPRHRAPFKLRLLGPPDHNRFVVRDARRLVDTYWTGKGWSRSLGLARLYADPDDVAKVVEQMTRLHLRRHEPKRLFTMTLVVRVHAPEDVTRADVEHYLRDALVVGVDHRKYGTGPTEDSLVEVVVPVISLEEGH